LAGFEEPSRTGLLVEHRRQHALRGCLLACLTQRRVALEVGARKQGAGNQYNDCGEDEDDASDGDESHEASLDAHPEDPGRPSARLP
jgi:hypothetical protein